MRVYCKCLNVEVTVYAPESKGRHWKTIALEAEDDDLPQSIDHESFQDDVFHFKAKAAHEISVRQDDIISRRRRMQEEDDFHSTLSVHAYLPHLILTHRRTQWRVRECFLCRTTVMACLHRGLSTVCPANLVNTSSEDSLFAALNAGSARLWMFSREALCNPLLPLTGTALKSIAARQHLESMNQVWRVAQTRAQAELEQRLEALRRQEMATYEEDSRLAKEMQHQVANAYYGLLSVLSTEHDAYIEAEEEEEKRKQEEKLRRAKALKEQADGLLAEKMRTDRYPLTHASGDDGSFGITRHQGGESHTELAEVEVATEALDLYETDLFDDGPRGGDSSENGDNNGSDISVTSAQEEEENREESIEKRPRGGEDDDEEANMEHLSTSAISSSIQARVGMRANVRSSDDRLPDADAFNAMTDAERTYAIEKASYQMQDNRLHEIYGDMEPPFLQELRLQAERARNPVPPLEEDVTTERRDSPL